MRILAMLFLLSPWCVLQAQLEWHPTLEEGLAEAGQIGQAVFLVTMWKTSV